LSCHLSSVIANIWWLDGAEFWLFAIYSKDEVSDLTEKERKLLAEMLRAELAARQ
jgi:hypothetical protein